MPYCSSAAISSGEIVPPPPTITRMCITPCSRSMSTM
jgi:hypothetical protein